MIPDQNLRICEAKSLVANAGSTVYSDAIDLGVLRNIGVGTPLFLRLEVTTSIAQAGGGINVQPVWADNDGLTTNAVRGIQLQLTQTNGSDGAVYYIPITPIVYNQAGSTKVAFPNDSKKFFGLLFGVFTNNVTAGAVTVDIVTEINLVENVYTGAMKVK